jgi:single-strand DNA-binding protein
MASEIETDNQVFLRGRLGAPAQLRELPSGDTLCSFRVTVPRPPGSRARVDSIDCAATTARVRRVLDRAQQGDELELTGRLQRRFWRSATGLASKYEVEVQSARVSSRRRSDASPARTRASG